MDRFVRRLTPNPYSEESETEIVRKLYRVI